MIWLFYFPFMLITMVFCYVTNPIVVLFAAEEGELHGIWHYWQTWDDTLDSKYMMTEVVPNAWYGKFLRYDWESKYEWYQDTTSMVTFGNVIDKVRLRPGATFTIKERIQRYLCRVLWVTRNCAYGFAMNVFGALGRIEDLVVVRNDNEDKDNEFIFMYDKSENILIRPWTLRFYKKICGNFYITGYLGWKIPYWHGYGMYCSMIANRIVPRFHPND